MDSLIDLFSPREVLHIVGISNQLNMLETMEKKYLLAVRMGAQKSEEGWELDTEEKEKFNPIFSRFMNHLPKNHECEKEECKVCRRFRSLKADFNGQGESEEFSLLMRWVSSGQSHYSGSSPGPDEPELERFSSDKELPRKRKKRVKVVATPPKREEPSRREERTLPLLKAADLLGSSDLSTLNEDDINRYANSARDVLRGISALFFSVTETVKKGSTEELFHIPQSILPQERGVGESPETEPKPEVLQ